MIKLDCNLAIDTKDAKEMWCVYEHLDISDTTVPPLLVFVGAEKLTDVYHMRQARMNSAWIERYGDGGSILIRIVYASINRLEIINKSIQHVQSFTPTPHCNLHGFNLYNSRRKVLCNNGQTYDSQTDAATALGLNQSAISRHMSKGTPKTVKGFTFTHAPMTT